MKEAQQGRADEPKLAWVKPELSRRRAHEAENGVGGGSDGPYGS